MAENHRHRPIAGFHLFLLILFIGHCVEAQPPSNESINRSNNTGPGMSPNFNPSMAIIIVVLVSAFFFLGFFSIYIRQCSGDQNDNFAIANVVTAAADRLRFQRGLDPDVLENFPTLVYSEVKDHKIGKRALECAICLNEFEDDETIRLLPECDHVFHQDCIDAWLGTHVTCPVCRTNYSFYSPDRASIIPARNDGAILAPVPNASALPSDAPPADHVAITEDDMNERKADMRELARIASKVRANGPRRSKRLPRSHSTGHSMIQQGEAGLDRFTLRLPENMRKEIMASGKLHRARTFAVTVTVGGASETSTRKISRGAGEGSSRRGRTIHLGRSDRWPSFFGRSLSARISSLGNRRSREEGCVKEKSISRKLSGVKTIVDNRGGATAAAPVGGSNGNGGGYTDEGSTAALNQV